MIRSWIGALVLLMIPFSAARAEDWPTYQHDPARSGITAEKLPLPLSESWVFKSRHAPQPAWDPPREHVTEGFLELRRNHFDDAFQVASAGGAVFFGSSAENKVYCLDAATGHIRWTRILGGPVRLAPTVAEGRVYVGADDGCAYCLDAKDGSVVWQFQAAPEDRRVLGHGRMISLWPLRTGILVDGGITYFAAGIFPAEGVFLYALDARTGREIWRNDSAGEAPQSNISPQGYLLASPTLLYAPLGRTSPAVFDRKTGIFKRQVGLGHGVGGTYALLAGDDVYTGTEQLASFQVDRRDRLAVYPGRKILVAGKVAYLATDTQLIALDRVAYPAAQARLQSLRAKAQQLTKKLPVPAKRSEASRRQGDALAEEIKKAEQEVAAATRWQTPCNGRESLILAGETLVAGGPGEVTALDAATGKVAWTAKVDGTAKGLAAAGGRLLASTDTGAIYSFGPAGASPAGTVAEPVDANPYRSAPAASPIGQAAETILKESGVRRGFCLVLGFENGQLAFELARRSQLSIYAVSPDKEKVAAARKALDAAGLYGSRVCVEQWPLDRVPYSDYFANLIVSESAVLGGPLPPNSAEVWRMLKPEGGVALLGQAASAEPVKRWLTEAKLDGQVIGRDGYWTKIVRGPIPGGGSWTHLYGNPGNTGCGDDRALRCPLGVLWFGQPGPAPMVNRHERAAGPLAVDGRLLVQGENVVMAYDAYNGLKLWERPIPGAMRVNASHDGSNLAIDHKSLFVGVRDQCLRLDVATGRTLATYELPPPADPKNRRWGYVASADGLLFGSRSGPGTATETVFAREIESGKLRWTYEGKKIAHNSIAVAGGRVFLLDANVSDAQRKQALDARRDEIAALPVDQREAAQQALGRADIRLAVALDAQSGKPLWRVPLDLSHCGGGNIAAMSDGRVLMLFGVYLDGHLWKQFFAGEFASRRVTLLAAEDGRLLWSKPVGYRVRPILIGDTLHAEPWAFDLWTGQPRTQPHPITGRTERWQFARPGHHCGLPIGTANCLFFRSWCLGYYDLIRDAGTMHFGAQRPGCWVNFIPAGGLLLMPEASSGCMCPFPNMCSLALAPVEKDKAFKYASAAGRATPVRRVALNFGAPGDRKDAEGNLWLGLPRPTGSLVLPLKPDVVFLPGGSYVQQNSAYASQASGPWSWLFASAARGVSRCSIPLLGKADGAALYRVRLAMLDPDNDRPGQRVFDVKLQGKLVLENFDILKEAGEPRRPVFKEFSEVPVRDRLTIQFIPKTAKPSPRQAPIVQGIEIVRQRVLELGCTVPDLTLSTLEPKQAAEIQLVNLRETPFEGRLEVTAPSGLRVTPERSDVKLASEGQATIRLEAAISGDLPVGMHEVRARLVRADGSVELERSGKIEHLGKRARVVLRAIADSYVTQRYPSLNKGAATELLVDGGNREMEDPDHSRAFLKFRLDFQGKPLSARLRIHNAGNPSGEGGRLCLVEGTWNETTLTYANQPKLGKAIGDLGAVMEDQVVERPIPAELLTGTELSVAIDPTSCDGVDYLSRESDSPPQLIVEYEPR